MGLARHGPLVSLLAYNFNVTLPLFVTKGLGAGEGTFYDAVLVLSFGSVVSALVVAHRTLVTMRDIVRGAAALGVSLLLLSVVPGVGLAVPAVFLVGAASLLYMTGVTTHRAAGIAARHAWTPAGAADGASGWQCRAGRAASWVDCGHGWRSHADGHWGSCQSRRRDVRDGHGQAALMPCWSPSSFRTRRSTNGRRGAAAGHRRIDALPNLGNLKGDQD